MAISPLQTYFLIFVLALAAAHMWFTYATVRKIISDPGSVGDGTYKYLETGAVVIGILILGFDTYRRVTVCPAGWKNRTTEVFGNILTVMLYLYLAGVYFMVSAARRGEKTGSEQLNKIEYITLTMAIVFTVGFVGLIFKTAYWDRRKGVKELSQLTPSWPQQ